MAKAPKAEALTIKNYDESFKENWVKSREVIDRVLDCV